jgi:hypothetical protein
MTRVRPSGARVGNVDVEHPSGIKAAIGLFQRSALFRGRCCMQQPVQRQNHDSELAVRQRQIGHFRVNEGYIPGRAGQPRPRRVQHRGRRIDARKLSARPCQRRHHAPGAARQLQHRIADRIDEVRDQRDVLLEGVVLEIVVLDDLSVWICVGFRLTHCVGLSIVAK